MCCNFYLGRFALLHLPLEWGDSGSWLQLRKTNSYCLGATLISNLCASDSREKRCFTSASLFYSCWLKLGGGNMQLALWDIHHTPSAISETQAEFLKLHKQLVDNSWQVWCHILTAQGEVDPVLFVVVVEEVKQGFCTTIPSCPALHRHALLSTFWKGVKDSISTDIFGKTKAKGFPLEASIQTKHSKNI